MRVPVLGLAARNGPCARVQLHVGPLHPYHFAASLAGQESGPEDAAHGGGEVVKRRPQGADLSGIQHALPRPFGAGLLDEGRGVGRDPLMRHREIQHASYERQHAIRHDRRVVGDGGDQRVHVASGHVGDESVAPVREELACDDALVFRPALLVGFGVAREVLIGQVCDRGPVAGVEAVCRRVRAVKRDLGEDLPRLRARRVERDVGVVAEGHPAQPPVDAEEDTPGLAAGDREAQRQAHDTPVKVIHPTAGEFQRLNVAVGEGERGHGRVWGRPQAVTGPGEALALWVTHG